MPASLRILDVKWCTMLAAIPDLSECSGLAGVSLHDCKALRRMPALPRYVKPSVLDYGFTDNRLLVQLAKQRPELRVCVLDEHH
jgi:hypothetical protein